MEVTTRQRVEFMAKASGIVSELNTISVKAYEEAAPLSKRINVSSMKKVANTFGDTLNAVNKSTIGCIEAMMEMLEVYKADKYNVGEYKEAVLKALDACQMNRPVVTVTDKMSIGCDGNEDVSAARIAELDGVVTAFGKKTRSALMDLSAVAGNLKQDEASRNIGKKFEEITNTIILQCNIINKEIEEFAKAYKIQIGKIEDMSASIKSDVDSIDTNFSGIVEHEV